MNLSRRELNKENKKPENENINKDESAVKRNLKNGKNLLVEGVVVTALAAGLALGGCGSAKTQGEEDSRTDRTGGRLDNVDDTATDTISDLVDEDSVSDVPSDGMDVLDDEVIEDSVSDSEDAVGDSVEDSTTEDVAGDTVVDEDITGDIEEEDVTGDTPLDSEWDTISDTVDEDISGDLVDADTLDIVDGTDTVSDTPADGSDVVGDTSDDVVSDLVEEGDVVTDMEEDEGIDGVSDVYSDGTDVVSEDIMEEDVVDEDATLVCRPSADSITDAWIATGTASLVGGVYIMYTGMDHSGNGLYDIICGGTIVRSDVPVSVGSTVTVDVLEMGFRVEIGADSVSSIGTTSDIEVSILTSAVCTASDSTRTEVIYIGGSATVGNIDVRYDGPTTSGEGEYSILCDGTVVRSGITVAAGSTETVDVTEQSFSVELTPSSVNPFNTMISISVDAY